MKTYRRTPFQLPHEDMKQIIAVTDNEKIIAGLEAVARKEGAQLCLVRPETPDIIVFSGNVRVVDREYLGKESWDMFCEYLSMVNTGEEYPIIDENGEVLIEAPVYDRTPIIIIDESSMVRLSPENALGKVYYMKKQAHEFIGARVRKILRESPSPVFSMITAVEESGEDGRPLY